MISGRLRRRASIGLAVLLLLIGGAFALLRSCAGDDNLIGLNPEPGLDFDNQTSSPLIFYSVNPDDDDIESEFLRLEPHSGEFVNPTFDPSDRCLQTAVRIRLATSELVREVEPGECRRVIVTEEDIPNR